MGFGEQLRSERERQHYTLDDVAASTKISTRMLHALEEEKFNQLPGGIFNKGFVRAYATFLKIDEEQAVADYLAAAGEAPPPSLVGERVEQPVDFRFSSYGEGPDQGSRLPWGWLALVLVLGAAGYFGWRYYQHGVRDRQSAEAVAVVAQSAPAAAQTPAQTPPQTLGQPPAAALAANPAANPAEAAPAGSFTVSVQATEDCWLSVVVDGKSDYSAVLAASGVKSVHALRRVTVRAGNIGALAITFNGQPLPAQGSRGQTKTLTFGPNGLMPAQP